MSNYKKTAWKDSIETEITAEKLNNMEDGIETLYNERSHVGMIIQSTTLDTMEKVINLYGGTKWEKIEGRFLLGASNDYAVNKLGGEYEHVLSAKEMPSAIYTPYGGGTTGSSTGAIDRGTIYTNSTVEGYAILPTQGGQAHNNMPPYKAVYIWERVE